LYKIFAFSFSYAFFCLSLSFMYLWVCPLSVSVPYDVLKSKTLRVHAPQIPCRSHQQWLWLTYLKKEENKWVRYIRDLQMVLTSPYIRKQSATLANFMFCYQKIFVPIKLSSKFMQILANDQRTFCLVFALFCRFFHKFLHFECITAINRDRNFEDAKQGYLETPWRETIKFFTIWFLRFKGP